jgi:hypothetical protein
MTVTLDDIRDTMDKSTGDGRNLELARELAHQYVEENPDQFTRLAGLSREACVATVTTFRNDGMDDEAWIVETWLLHQWNPAETVITGGINLLPDQL